MDAQQHLFELLNAGPGLTGLRLAFATALAEYLIYAIPISFIAAWLRGSAVDRRDLLRMFYACVLALALAQLMAWFFPERRPFVLHLGQQYIDHVDDAGMPSDHVTVFWSLALAAFGTARYAALGFPLLALGLAVGWSRIYLGVHFPLDILAALPVATLGAALAGTLDRPADAVLSTPLVDFYSRIERRWHDRWFPHNGGS